VEKERKAAAKKAQEQAQEEKRKKAAAAAIAAKKLKEKQRKAQEAAQKKAKRVAEKARLKAEREEAKRMAREAAEQAKAKQEEIRREARQEAQRIQAEKVEAARLAAENAAREKARQAVQRKQHEAELAEQRALQKEAKLLAAAEAARREAEVEHHKAEAAAKLQAQQEEARLVQKLAQAEAQEARKSELAAQKLQREKEKRRKAKERAKRKATEQAQREHQAALARTERQKLEDQVVATSAARLKNNTTGAANKPRVKTRLEVPNRNSPSHSDKVASEHANASKAATKPQAIVHSPGSQPGAPNFYTLLAFHNSQALRQRPSESAAKARSGTMIAAGLLTILAISLAVFSLHAPDSIGHGPIAISSSSDGKLLVMGTDALYLHDRSGVGTLTLSYDELGLDSLRPPIRFDADGTVLGLGALHGSTAPMGVVRCVLADKQCTRPFEKSTEQAMADTAMSFAINSLNGDRYILSESPFVLTRFDARNKLLAEASIPVAEQPILRLDSGLIFVNSEFESAISVFRPDVANFGQQLDEVLLMPTSAVSNQYSLVIDFLPIDQQWWAVLGDSHSQNSALYRFDASWRLISEHPLPQAYYPAQLSRWGDKLLVSHPSQTQQLRVSKDGVEEAHYQSDLMVAAINASEAHAARRGKMQRVVPALLLSLLFIAIGYTWIHRLRSRVYRHSKAQGAETLDESLGVSWVDLDPQRSAGYRQLAMLTTTGYAGLLVICIGLAFSPGVIAAVLLALSGPVITLYLLYRSPVGHIGSHGDKLVLVDHNGLYHMGAGPRIAYRSRFVLIDDIVVFTGASLLPTFDPKQLKALEATITAGVKVEAKAVWIRLLQARHPLAVGSIICALGVVAAGLVLAL